MIVGINGFGRIGKQIYRILIKNGIKVPLINDPFLTLEDLYYQAKYDSIYGCIDDITLTENSIIACSIQTFLSKEKDPKDIEWAKYKVSHVIECSGVFRTLEDCNKHDASRVILTCPSDDIPMYVMGVNEEDIGDEKVISAASCTTNCLAPLVRLMNENFEIEEGFVSTIHALTGTQNTVDGKGRSARISRSFMNIIPTTTGAAKAIEVLIPEVKGKISAMAYRVPVPVVSVLDFVVRVKKPTDLETIKTLIKREKNDIRLSALGVMNENLVSSDLIGDTRSSILDFNASSALSPYSFKLVAWYDNEYAYSCRVVDMLFYIEESIEIIEE